jgi:flagellar motility protein MotE (MotC chaperone)
LERLRNDIERKVKELRSIQDQVASFVQKGKKISENRLKRLAKFYESAPPEKAGLLLSELDPSLAALILLRIDGRKAGRIWGFVVEDKAVRISQELTKLR